MTVLEVAPYFHPTQVVLVDDDIDFLGNLSLQLDADLAYLLFDSTQKALGYLNQPQTRGTVCERFFCEHVPRGGSKTDRSTLERFEIDTSAVHREMHSPERFSQISVVLVDYAMPQMNGLEFCRRIDDPHIKKILFTGVATEAVAVDAFNNGIIDQYIRKHEHSVYERLNRAIREFQQDYIRDIFVNAADALPLALPELLSSTEVARLIDELRRSYGLVEYYMAHEPAGFFFANASGELKRVVIQMPEDRRQAPAAARAKRSTPAEHGPRTADGEFIADPGLASSADAPARIFSKMDFAPAAPSSDSRGDLRWAVVDVSDDGHAGQVKPSYNEFLEWLDAVGYALM